MRIFPIGRPAANTFTRIIGKIIHDLWRASPGTIYRVKFWICAYRNCGVPFANLRPKASFSSPRNRGESRTDPCEASESLTVQCARWGVSARQENWCTEGLQVFPPE
jgi:hypothetical protein